MSGLKVARIADFCVTGSGGTPSRNQIERYYEGGTIPWVKSGELRESTINSTSEYVTEAALKESSIKLVPAGAILLAMYGATVGRLGILGIGATTNQAVCHIVPDPNLAETRYVFHAISHRVPDLIAMGVGGAQPNINQAIIKDLAIPLPPLSEQRRIAAILDQADALRAKRREALAKLDSLKQSIFIEMFGDPVVNLKRYPEKILGELVDAERGISYGIVQRGEDCEEGIPVLRITDVVKGKIELVGMKKTTESIAAKYRRTVLRGGEVVISIRGTVGRCAVVPKELAGGNISREVALIPYNDPTNSTFLITLLRNNSIQQKIRGDVKGVAQSGINLEDLRLLRIIQPPLTELHAFANRMKILEKIKFMHEVSLAELDALFAALQHRAFRGEL